MRIAINTRFLLKDKMEGFGWFTFETVKRIVENHPEHDFIFFFDRPFDPKYVFADNVTPVILNPPARHPVLFKIWFNYSVTKALKKYKADLFFSPDGYLSLRSNTPQIVVIHDLNFEHHPEDLPKSALKYLKTYFPKFAKKAAHIITVSQFSKDDIVATYGISPSKITVAYNGASEKFKPVDEYTKTDIRKKYTSGKPYFIFVGALHARKNINRLLLAFDEFKTATGSETQLLIVGEQLWKNAPYQEALDQIEHTDHVHFSGHVNLDTLTGLLGSARALTFVSYFEGFGIPLVEAMQAGTPIISGNKTALPEITAEAAILVDPYSITEISDALSLIDSNESLRGKLITLGEERAKAFSWNYTASIIWEEIEKILIDKSV